jgi:multisubunit Na+/H+ antiporter MnhF subunit
MFDFGDCCFDTCLLYCIVSFVLFVCSVFPVKFHVRLSYDRIMDLQNDMCMYVCMYICMYVYIVSNCQQDYVKGLNIQNVWEVGVFN